MERASKLTEMDVRSPGFDVKLSLFVPLLRVAAAKQSQAAADETQPEASTGTKAKLKDTVLALRAIEQCVLERELRGLHDKFDELRALILELRGPPPLRPAAVK